MYDKIIIIYDSCITLFIFINLLITIKYQSEL
jgi:hypothetical protein